MAGCKIVTAVMVGMLPGSGSANTRRACWKSSAICRKWRCRSRSASSAVVGAGMSSSAVWD